MDEEGLEGDRSSDCSHLLSGEEVTIIITVFGYPCEWVHIFLRTTNAYRAHLSGETPVLEWRSWLEGEVVAKTNSTHSGIVRLSRIVVKGHINIEVNGGHGWKEYTTLPYSDIDLSLGGMFIPCNQPPPSGDKVRITWTDPPFSKKTFRTTATLLETSGGIRLKFDPVVPCRSTQPL